MSLARRLTSTGGVDRVDFAAPTTPAPANPTFDTDPEMTRDGPRRQAIWRQLSYDAFATPTSPKTELQKLTTPSKGAHEVTTTKRVLQVGFAIFACWLASGIVCGFAALKPVLIAEGVYRDLCLEGDDGTESLAESGGEPVCAEQDMRLNLMFIAASITLNVSTVLAGTILDRHGRRACYLIAAVVLALGSLLMSHAFATLNTGTSVVDGFLLGNILLGLGGTFLFVSSYQLANAFPRHSGLVVALVTGAFDASAAVFLLYRMAYDATDGSFKPTGFFLLFLAVPVAILVAEMLLMPRRAYDNRPQLEHRLQVAADEGWLGTVDRIEDVAGDATERARRDDKAEARRETSGVWGVLHDLPIRQQMRTPWFVLVCLLTILQMLRMNYFIATVRAQYRYMLGDEEMAEMVNTFFDVALPVAGVLTTPFIGVLLNKVSVAGILAILTAMIVVLGVLNCLSLLWAGYATVVAFVLFRPLYYSAVSDYATKVFGFATFGRIYGTIICVSGLTNLVQPGLDALTHGPLDGNPVPINVFFAVGGALISIMLTSFVYSQGKRYQEEVDLAETAGERTGLLNEYGQSGEDGFGTVGRNGSTGTRGHVG